MSDPEGDTIVQYAVWDSGGGNGHWVINGVPQAAGVVNDKISAAQLAQTTYVFGSASDALSIKVFDGAVWSNWANFTTPFVTATCELLP